MSARKESLLNLYSSGVVSSSAIPNYNSGTIKWFKYGRIVVVALYNLGFTNQTSSMVSHSMTLASLGMPASVSDVDNGVINGGNIRGELYLNSSTLDIRTFTTSAIWGEFVYVSAS